MSWVRGCLLALPALIAGCVNTGPGPAATGPATGAQSRRTDVAIRGVTVVDVATGALLADRTVVVRGNRIVAVDSGRGGSGLAGTRIVDGAGKFLIPGLWDMHGHILHRWDWAARLDVANGVTGVRDMATHTPLARVQQIRAEVSAGRTVGPRFLTGGPLIDGEPAIFREYLAVGSVERAVAVVDSLHVAGADFIKIYTRLTREQFAAIVAQARRHGLAVTGHVPLSMTTAEASDAGMRSVEHAFRHRLACAEAEEEMRGLLHEQVEAQGRRDYRRSEMIEDSTFTLGLKTYSAERCSALGRRFAKNGTWFVPTLVEMRARFRPEVYFDANFDSLFTQPHLQYVPRPIVAFWRDRMSFDAGVRMAEVYDSTELAVTERPRAEEIATRLRMVGDLHRAGAQLLAGTDASENFALVIAGFSLHEELGLLVQAGLTPLQALQTATLNPARFLDATDSLGTVARGKVADLVLLDANPLDDIRNTTRIQAMVLNGRYFDRSALDALLEEARHAAQQAEAH